MRRLLLILVIYFSSLSSITGEDIPTLVPPDSFDPNADARTLHDAVAGLGTDETAIINVLCSRGASQRVEISNAYYDLYKKTLQSDLQGDLSGQFQNMMVDMTYTMAHFLAVETNSAVANLGTDESLLLEILMSRTNAEILEINTEYSNMYGNNLLSDISLDTSGSFQDLLLQLAQGHRDESGLVDPALVDEDVANLYNAGEAILGTNEKVFTDIFARRNFPHLAQVAIQYGNTHDNNLEYAIDTEFSGFIRKSLLTILQYSRDKAAYFAQRFNEAVSGLGTNERQLIRLTVSRAEINMVNIRNSYQQIYGQTLSAAVAGDTSGFFEDALLKLIG